MAVYNEVDYLENSIESVLNQTCKEFDFLVVNSGSSPACAVLLEKYKKKDSRIKIIASSLNNLASALNAGLAACSGQYVMRQDADDVSLPDRMQKQMDFIERLKLDIIGTFGYLMNEKGSILKVDKRPCTHEEIAKRLFVANCILHPTVMFKKESILRIGGYNVQYEFSQDYELYLRGLRAGLKYGCLPEPLVKIRHRAGASSVKNRRRQLLFALSAQANYFAHQRKFSFYSMYCILTHLVKIAIPLWVRGIRLWIRNRR